MKIKSLKKISILLLCSILITSLFSSCKNSSSIISDNLSSEINTSGELVYDEFNPENIYLYNNETIYIKNVDKNHKFSFYSEYEYNSVKILDSSNNSFYNKVIHYNKNYNYNMYLIDFTKSEYTEGMNYTIELPNYNDYFLIKDIEKVNTITFSIKTSNHENVEYLNEVDFNKTYNSITEIPQLKNNEIALVDDNDKIIPYIMSDDGEIIKARFSDVYKSVNIFSEGTLNTSFDSNENMSSLYSYLKDAIINSAFYRNLVMTTYADEIDTNDPEIKINVEKSGTDTKITSTINISKDHTLVLTCIFNISYNSNIIISDTTNIEQTFNFDNMDFSILLNVKEFSIKDTLSNSFEKKVDDASKLISNEDKINFLKSLNISDKEIQNKKTDLLTLNIPIAHGFFIKCNVPFSAVFNYDGKLNTSLNMPSYTKIGFRFNKSLKSLQPYQSYDYKVDFDINGEIKLKSHVGIGVKATLYAINEELLSINAGGSIKLHNEDEFIGNLNVKKNSKNENSTATFEFKGHIKVYLTIDIYGGALISSKTIPIIGQLLGFEANPKFEKEIYNKIIFEKSIDYLISTPSNLKSNYYLPELYCYPIDEETMIVTKYQPDRKVVRFYSNCITSHGVLSKGNKNIRINAKRIIIADQLELKRISNATIPCARNNTEIINFKYLFSDKTEDLSCMFYASVIEEIDFRGCNLSHVKNMEGMFSQSKNLRKVNFSGCDLRNVQKMTSMFSVCTSLEEVDFSDVKTGKISETDSMFNHCTSLKTIDLSSIDLSTVYYLYKDHRLYSNGILSMFNGCSELKTIYVSNEPNVDNIPVLIFDDSIVFSDCNNLVGGNGSTLASLKAKYPKKSDFSFAVIDNELHEGLLTKK